MEFDVMDFIKTHEPKINYEVSRWSNYYSSYTRDDLKQEAIIAIIEYCQQQLSKNEPIVYPRLSIIHRLCRFTLGEMPLSGMRQTNQFQKCKEEMKNRVVSMDSSPVVSMSLHHTNDSKVMFEESELNMDIEHLSNQLAPNERQVVDLIVSGCPYREIAKRTGITMYRIRQIGASLKNLLEERAC